MSIGSEYIHDSLACTPEVCCGLVQVTSHGILLHSLHNVHNDQLLIDDTHIVLCSHISTSIQYHWEMAFLTGQVEGSYFVLQDTLGHSLQHIHYTSRHSISLLTSLTVAVCHACCVTASVHLGLCYIPIMYECSTNRQCCLALYDCATVCTCTYISTTVHCPLTIKGHHHLTFGTTGGQN